MQIEKKTPIDDQTRSGLGRIADVILPGTAVQPSGTAAGAHLDLLDLVLEADPRLIDAVLDFGQRATMAEALTVEGLKAWSEENCEKVIFSLTSAYYMSSSVRRALEYPGQSPRPISGATPEEVCSDELIEPVVSRGSIYVSIDE
jgi:hypothetical protein